MMAKKAVSVIFVVAVFFGAFVQHPTESLYAEEVDADPIFSSSTAFRLTKEPERPRNYWFPPLVSFVLPGFDQWVEGQYAYAAAYTGAAALGITYAAMNSSQYAKQHRDDTDKQSDFLESHDNLLRKATLGSLVYQGAGGLSAYHSFRSTVPGLQAIGKFRFLKKEETPAEVLMSPFQFSYLKRPTTWVPLALIAGIGALSLTSDEDTIGRHRLRSDDVFFSAAYSYNAGTHEEALFRGWMMPMAMEWTGSELWSNTGTAAVFALAHLGTVDVPVAQFLLGWYLGHLTQKNQWTLGEAIFVHTWWDVGAFLLSYHLYKKETKEGSSLAALPVLWLPRLTMAF